MMHLKYYGILKLLFFFIIKMSSSFEHPEAVAGLANSQNLFSRDLYQTLIAGSSENIFFSPFSIMTAVAMTHMGAKSNTEKQIQSAFHFPTDKQLIKDALRDIISVINRKSQDYQLDTANSLFISDRFNILNEYFNTLVNDFHSKTESVNYDAPEVVRKQINDFVEVTTHSKIKDLIPADVLTPLTRMVIVNAVYFKGLWEHQFDPKRTTDQTFWLSNVNKISVPMMSNKKMFNYAKKSEIKAKVLSLDYKGKEMSMVMILPDEKDGLAELEATLANTDFATLDTNLYATDIKVQIPKFKLENSFELSDTLKQLGVKDLFIDVLADLSGISGRKDLYVSNVVHKSFIEVNEEGSEAAAATGIIGIVFATRLIMNPEVFIADHPFFFYIKHKPSGQILFMGRVINPESTA